MEKNIKHKLSLQRVTSKPFAHASLHCSLNDIGNGLVRAWYHFSGLNEIGLSICKL